MGATSQDEWKSRDVQRFLTRPAKKLRAPARREIGSERVKSGQQLSAKIGHGGVLLHSPLALLQVGPAPRERTLMAR